MPDALAALGSSVERLADLVNRLDDKEIDQPAYPTEWTIADVMSHLGSGGVISRRRLQDTLDDTEASDDFNQKVWDEWNAKSPQAKTNDAMAVDADLMSALEATRTEDRTRFHAAMGPIELDWKAFVGMRLNEHLVHEWDIAVALDPTAVLAADGTDLVVDNLDLIAGFTSKPEGDPCTISIGTTDPERWFIVTIEADQVRFSSGKPNGEPDLSMSAESLIRLVYGRLDHDHTPPSVVGERAMLEQLRAVFPGP